MSWQGTASYQRRSTVLLLSGVTHTKRFGRDTTTTATVRGLTRAGGAERQFVKRFRGVGAARPYSIPVPSAAPQVTFDFQIHYGGSRSCTTTAVAR